MASQQSLNHLLNFTLPPRQTHVPQSLPRRSRKTGIHQGVWNKERFVNAQYRFVMKPTGDYTVHFADPDIFFQWQDILQVIIPRTSALAAAGANSELNAVAEGHTTCPICLSPPVAPRMTKCGHVFCFPCILHYLNTSDNLKWVRCPICFDSVNEKQLKSVKWFDGPPVTEDDPDEPFAEASSSSDHGLVTTPRPGSTLRMRLMQRPQITTLALPRSVTWPSDLIPPHRAPFHFLPDVFSFAKFMLATPSYLIEHLSRDLDGLAAERQTLVDMHDELSVTFVDAADAKLRNEIMKASALETEILQENVERARRDQQEIEGRAAVAQRKTQEESTPSRPPVTDDTDDIPEEFLALQSTGTSTVTAANPAANTSRNVRPRRNLNPPPPSTSTYYYYQCASGAPIFLHPLDIRILLAHFTSYASFPDTISVRVESLAEGTVNDELRRRCKYLAHMPEGADVVFVEADLEGVVGEEGTRNFEGALKMRRGRRREKGKKDDKARARAEEREREKLVVPDDNGFVWREGGTGNVDEVPVVEEIREALRPQVSGAWGARSFASATASATPPRTQGQRPVRREEEDEWDVDLAWHELEQRSGGGGRRKRSKKLVILGGAGGRAR